MDVDATVEAATRLGATVQTPTTALPNGGRFAALVDPQGAPFGIHASSAAAGPEAAPQPGEFSWHELSTTVAPSIAFGFYAALFDWDEINQHDMGPMGMYLVFGRNGRQLGGMFDKGSAGKPGNAYWLGYVSVTDLEATVERAKAARASVLTGPMDVPGGDRIAQLMDPHGAFFALHTAAGAQAASAQPAAKPSKAAKPAAAKTPHLRRSPAPAKAGSSGETRGSSETRGSNAGEAGSGQSRRKQPRRRRRRRRRRARQSLRNGPRRKPRPRRNRPHARRRKRSRRRRRPRAKSPRRRSARQRRASADASAAGPAAQARRVRLS